MPGWGYFFQPKCFCSLLCSSRSESGGGRTCYRRLAVSEDGSLRFLYERVVEMRDAGYREDRAAWLARFVRHLIAAEKVHLRVRLACGLSLEATLSRVSACQTPQGPCSRATLALCAWQSACSTLGGGKLPAAHAFAQPELGDAGGEPTLRVRNQPCPFVC